MSLSAGDFDRFLRLLPALYEFRHLHAFLEHSLRLVRGLISCDQARWVAFQLRDQPRPPTLVGAIPVASPQIVALLTRVFPRQPFAARRASIRRFGPLMTADISRRARESQYGEHGRFTSRSKSHGLGTPISMTPEHLVSLGLRRRTRPFTERDRAVMTVLQPHLACALENTTHVTEVGLATGMSSGDVPESPLAATLTPREREVAHWLTQGKTNGEIALILGTSPRTIEKHVERILHKLGVENRTTAAIELQ
jgi:DNA-binding CsgD family transcriptional regulator